MATITMAQASQLTKEPLAKNILIGFAQEGVMLDLLNFRDLGGRMAETGIRLDELTTPDWIAIDGTISSKSVNTKPISFSTYQLAAHIDVPKQLDDANTDQVARVLQTNIDALVKGTAFEINDTFVNGDQGSNVHQPNGIRRLLADLPSGQVVGSTAIDLTGSYSDAVAEAFFARLDLAMYKIDGHKPDFALANADLLLAMESWGRQYNLRGTNFDWSSHGLGVGDVRESLKTKATMPAFSYRGVPFYDLGLKSDQATKVIGNTYAEGGSSSLATRVMFVKQGPQQFEALQFAPLETINVGGAADGTLEDKMTRRKRVTMAIGFAAWTPRCLSMAAGIQVNVVT